MSYVEHDSDGRFDFGCLVIESANCCLYSILAIYLTSVYECMSDPQVVIAKQLQDAKSAEQKVSANMLLCSFVTLCVSGIV